MNCFIVIIDKGTDETTRLIESKFPDHNHEIVKNSVWAVASEKSAPSDICKILGIGKEKEIAGVVARTQGYNGYFIRSLWEKMDEWENME